MSDSSDHNLSDVYHDETQRSEVGEILASLPIDHPARVAYQLGQGPITISHLLSDKALVHRMTVAFLDGLNRSLLRTRNESKSGPRGAKNHMTEAHSPRFLDKEEWVAVKLIVEELDPLHPIRIAFSEGADTIALLRSTADSDLRRRLREVHADAVDRQVTKSKPRKP